LGRRLDEQFASASARLRKAAEAGEAEFREPDRVLICPACGAVSVRLTTTFYVADP
jgi:hypothetical protein